MPLNHDKESATYTPTEDSLTSLVLGLSPLEKQTLDELADHPLLTGAELALLVRSSIKRVQRALAALEQLQLVEARGPIPAAGDRGNEKRYLLAPRGQQYLAMVAGFGRAVRRYARARGWSRGFDVLVRHWIHTREENAFFLHLARIARQHAHVLIWSSELESRLYYELNGRRHSFLPDGRGTYIAGGKYYEFVVEIDRSRAAQEKLQRKFAEYAACAEANVLRQIARGEFLRVLVITTSWERATTVRHTAQAFASADLPIFITTFDRLQASGADAPIWLRVHQPDAKGDILPEAAALPKTYCFECFIPQPQPKPPPRAVIIKERLGF